MRGKVAHPTIYIQVVDEKPEKEFKSQFPVEYIFLYICKTPPYVFLRLNQ